MASTGQRQQPQASTSGRPFTDLPHARDHPYDRGSSPSQSTPEIVFQNPGLSQQSPQGRMSLASFAAGHLPTSRRSSPGPNMESQKISPRLSPHESLVRTANGDLWSRGPNSKALEPLGSWQGDWGLDTQQELSVAVQPSEGGHFQNPLTTAASFTDQHSMAGSRKDGLLTSRTLYDVDGRYPLFTSPQPLLHREDNSQKQGVNGWGDSSHDVRKQIMGDSALEAKIHLENVAHHKSMGKHGGMMHPFGREGVKTGPLPDSKQKDCSRSRCKPRLTKAQIDFMGMQPQKLSQQLVKKPAGIFHRQMQSSGDRSGGGRPTQRGDASGINRLDARNDKAVNTHDRIVAWIEQGERYMQEHHPAVYSPVRATVDVDPPGGRRGKPSPYIRSVPTKMKHIQDSMSLLCCGAPGVK